MTPQHAAYLSRLRAQVKEVQDMSQIPSWISEHTRSPKNNDDPFSFLGHEYQIEMIGDPSPVSAVKKCSQVGASEIWFRFVLAFMAMFKSINLIYVLPTLGFVRKVSKGRIDVVINNSPTLKSALNKNVNSVELKQIYNSFLYMAGASSKSSGISVPARGVIKDEVDFCDQGTLSTFASRMGHNAEHEIIDRSFSTPTVYDYGIDELFKRGSQAYYCVKCPTCHDYSKLNYMTKVEIPGFQGTLETLERDDLLNPLYKFKEAFMRCSLCNAPIPHKQFLDPANRKWIHTYPDLAATFSSRQVYPLDVPTVNPLPRTIAQLADYKRKKDWVNFKVGEAYQDSETSFVEANIRMHSIAVSVQKPTDMPSQAFHNCLFGLDVGKTCHLLVGTPNGQGREGLDVIYAERIRQTGDNYVLRRLKELSKTFNFVGGVVDSAPDITLAESVTDWRPGKFWACQYLEKMGNTLDIVRLVDEEGIAKVLRNSALDEIAKRVNAGKTRLNRANPEYEIIIEHLKAMKKVSRMDEDSDELAGGDEVWVATKEDHYAHALNYLNVAAYIAGSSLLGGLVPFNFTSVLTARPKGPDPETYQEDISMLYRPGQSRRPW